MFDSDSAGAAEFIPSASGPGPAPSGMPEVIGSSGRSVGANNGVMRST